MLLQSPPQRGEVSDAESGDRGDGRIAQVGTVDQIDGRQAQGFGSTLLPTLPPTFFPRILEPVGWGEERTPTSQLP